MTEKPPLGIVPRHIWYEERFQNLQGAIIRYANSGSKIPKEWVQEYNHILEMKENDNNTKK